MVSSAVSHLTSPHLFPSGWSDSLGWRHPSHMHSERGVRNPALPQKYHCGAGLKAASTSIKTADQGPSLRPQPRRARGDGRRLQQMVCWSCHFPQMLLQLPPAGEQRPPEPDVVSMAMATLGGFLLQEGVLLTPCTPLAAGQVGLISLKPHSSPGRGSDKPISCID